MRFQQRGERGDLGSGESREQPARDLAEDDRYLWCDSPARLGDFDDHRAPVGGTALPGQQALAADPEATYPFGIFCAQPVHPWHEPGVTLLGDAIHTMTPGRGEGANTALRDAYTLTGQLVEVAAGASELPVAEQRYETEMLRYGFEAVERSRSPFFAAAMKKQPRS